jgi:hypothetical protein
LERAAKVREMPDVDRRQSGWMRFVRFSETTTAAIIGGVAAIVTSVIAAIGTVITSKNQGTAKPTSTHPFDYLPYLLALIGLIAIAILVVGVVAARAGIRKRERRLDLIERLLLPDTVPDDDTFTKDARKSFVSSLGQFAKDVVDLSRKISRRESSDVVTARHITRAAELLSVGSASRRGNYMGSIGGVILGAGLAELFVVLAETKPSPLEIGLTFAASIVGVVLLAYQWFSG